jgi:hypothetical protein
VHTDRWGRNHVQAEQSTTSQRSHGHSNQIEVRGSIVHSIRIIGYNDVHLAFRAARKKVVTELPLGSLLLVATAESVGDGVGSVAEAVLSLLHDTLALLGGVVGAATDGVANLLAGGLLALCTVLAYVEARAAASGVRTRLNGAGNAVSSSGDVLTDLVGGGLLRVRGHWRWCQCLVSGSEGGGTHSSQTPARRDPCACCQTC